jgi:4-amino-4-deoxy-L-arabinose transferase-like glycosyltransferase
MASSFWSAPEVIVDASRYFTQAKQLSVYGVGYFAEQWGREIFAWTDLPLVPFLYGLVFKFFGEQRIFIQALNTFFYSSTVVLTYQLGKTLWDEDTGFRSGLLLLGFPYVYTQVPLMLTDVPTMFFFMLAVVASAKALKNGGAVRIILAAFTLFLVFYVKYSTWMLLTLMPIIYAYFIYVNPSKVIRRGGWVALLALVMTVTFFLVYKDILGPQLGFLLEYQKPGLHRWGESYISTFLFQIHPFITAAALFAIFKAARKMDFSFLIVSFLLFLFLFLQVKRIRYTMPVFPMFALMAAYGMGEIQNKKVTKQVVLSVVGTTFVVAYMGFLPFLKTLGVQNLQAAGHFVNSIPGANVEVVSFAGDNAVVNPATAVPVLDIYTHKTLVYEHEPIKPEVLERVKSAPLRFTWEFSLPKYYSPKPGTKNIDALVLISDDPKRPLPQDIDKKTSLYPFQKIFNQSFNIFQHQTFVTVYHK